MWDPYEEIKSTKLGNGLTIYSAYWPGRPWEVMGFLIHSGAEQDPVSLEGLAHFVEHSVSNALPKKELLDFFHNCGGKIDLGTTGYPDTYYRVFVPIDKDVLWKTFSFFGKMLLSAKLKQKIEEERQIILGEFNLRYPTKIALKLDLRERKALYSGHWLERFVRPLGVPESISRITEGDLQSFYDAHYTPANMSIVGVGGMKLEEISKYLSQSEFSVKKEGERTSLPTPKDSVSLPLENRFVFEMSKESGIHLEVGSYKTVAKIPGTIDSMIVNIAREMLQENLKEEIREKRSWSYAVDVSQINYRSFFEFSMNCGALNVKALDKIEKVVENCILSTSKKEDLFDQIKSRMISSNYLLDFNGKEFCGDLLGDLSYRHRIVTAKEVQKRIKNIKMSDISALFEYFKPEKRWTRIIRP